MDHADHMRASIALAVEAIRGADPARFADPSPCTGWTVGQAVNHVAFGLVMAAYGAEKRTWPPDWATEERAPYLRGSPEAQWAERAAVEGSAAAAAWGDPTAWEGDTPFGGSTMPAAAVGSMMTVEFVLHAWDITTALGRALPVPEPLAAAVLAGLQPIAQMGRDGGWFGQEVAVPPDASTWDRALAASGREPRWAPGAQAVRS